MSAKTETAYGVFRVAKTADDDMTPLDFMSVHTSFRVAVAEAKRLAGDSNNPTICTVLPVYRLRTQHT